MLNNLLSGKNKNQKRGRQFKGKRRAQNGLERQKGGHCYAIQSGPVFAPNMPKEWSISLIDRNNTQVNTITATFKQTYGLIEFLGRRPLYTTEFYAMYKFARVTAVNYHYEVVNTGQVPIEIMFAIMPFSDVATATAFQIGEKPGVVRHVISPLGGMDRKTISKTCVAQDWFGNPYYTRDYWVNQAQSLSAVPLDQEEPVGVFAVDPLGTVVATNCNFTITTRLTYHIQFFDLELATPSSLTKRPPEPMVVEDSDEDMEIVPKKKKAAK